jgi:hypothetical protein
MANSMLIAINAAPMREYQPRITRIGAITSPTYTP